MKKYIRNPILSSLLMAAFVLSAALSCTPENGGPGSPGSPDTPVVDTDRTRTTDGQERDDPRRKILWFDASANFERLSYPDSISYYLDLTRDAGITDVVLDLKPISGHVMYESRYAPQWITHHSGITRETDMDLVRFFIDEARERGLTTHFSINVFVGGHNYHDIGLVYELPGKQDWQAINYTPDGMRPITELKNKYSAMLIPSHPEVRQFKLNILREILQTYDFDGVILDRVRFDSIQSDFSPVSRRAFEQYLGTELERFPEDIYEWVDVDGEP
ncbi:MAG: hypothetical protein EA363_01195, partial [Balneolaceae bacterium]